MPSDWERCVAFHGHACAGLTIGYKAALLAQELLHMTFSDDEEIVCITENDACGVDAIQVMLGCSAGKGNLLFRLRGKHAFSFYNRTTQASVRLVLKPLPEGMTREEAFAAYQQQNPKDMFKIMPTTITVPPRAARHASIVCEQCGEATAEPMIRLKQGRKLCLDCATGSNAALWQPTE